MNLFVKGFEPTTTEEELMVFFQEYGEIQSLKLSSHKYDAFILFKDRESAKNAKEKAVERCFKGKHLVINYF